MTALDFITYCAGSGIVLVSFGVTVRLMLGAGVRRTQPVPQQPARVEDRQPREPVDPVSEGLVERLHTFQTTRYASPIVRRTLSDDAGPPPAFSRPRQPVNAPRRHVKAPPKDENVVQFPQKMSRTDEPVTKKES